MEFRYQIKITLAAENNISFFGEGPKLSPEQIEILNKLFRYLQENYDDKDCQLIMDKSYNWLAIVFLERLGVFEISLIMGVLQIGINLWFKSQVRANFSGELDRLRIGRPHIYISSEVPRRASKYKQ